MHVSVDSRVSFLCVFVLAFFITPLQLANLFLRFADSTNPECFTTPMAELVDMCYGNGKTTTLLPGPSNTLASGPTVPCPMSLLDSLTVHAKMRYV